MAIAASVLLLAVVLVRDVGVNPLNAWTIVLGGLGGTVALRTSGTGSRLLAGLLLLLAAVPALPGGYAVFFLPSLLLVLIGSSEEAAPAG